MKTIIFAVAGYNLAETGRHIEIAKACRDKFNIVFVSYGGTYESLIEEEGFKLEKMGPCLSEKQLSHVRKQKLLFKLRSMYMNGIFLNFFSILV